MVDARIYPVLDELRACLCAALAESAPCFCGVLVGQDIPVEYAGDCENCGAAYVRLSSAFPSSDTFPQQDISAGCSSVRAYSVYVGIVRCSPIGDESGEPPSPEEADAHARLMLSDMDAIWKAITCWFSGAYEDEIQCVVGMFTPLPTQGGISGGEQELTIQEPF